VVRRLRSRTFRHPSSPTKLYSREFDMPFSGNTYVPIAGSETASPGAVLQSAVWNAINTDYAAALTTLMTALNTTPSWSNILAANGGFAVWQRGAGGSASFSVNASTTQYTADRWYITTGANQASVVSQATGLTAAAVPGHAAKIVRTSTDIGVTAMLFGYPLTGDEIERLRGQMVSFSGAAKAGAGWSPALGAFTISLFVGTGTPQKAGAAGINFTTVTTPLSITVDLAAGATNTAISGTSTGVVPITSTQGELQVTWTPVGTAGADDSITFDQFCLVAGTLVQAFEDLPFEESLRLCKKFYRKSFPYAVAPAQNAGLPGAVNTVSAAATELGFFVQTDPVELYATAAVTTYNPSGSSASWANVANVSVTATLDTASPSAKGFGIFSAANVTAANEIFYIHYSADAGI
jgi:hypothetical protein